jgi:serine/threonine-protein kinase HipA
MKRVIFSLLTGNEDMHLKNVSLITYQTGRIDLTPAYDFVNSTIAMRNAKEEMALSINGKQSKLTRADLLDYYGSTRLELSNSIIGQMLAEFQAALPKWRDIIRRSFLSTALQERYQDLITEQAARLKLG